MNAPHAQRTSGLSLNEFANEGARKHEDSGKGRCWRCNRPGHQAKDCRVKPENFAPGAKGDGKAGEKGKSKGDQSGSAHPKGKGNGGQKGDGKSGKGKAKGKGKSKGGKKGPGKGKRAAEWSEDEGTEGSEVWSADGDYWERQSESEPEANPSTKSERLCPLFASCSPSLSMSVDSWIQNEPNTQCQVAPRPFSGRKKVDFDLTSNGSAHELWGDQKEGSLWLLDSGASKSVLNPQHLPLYKCLHRRTLPVPLRFSTANGDTVEVSEEVFIEAWFLVFDTQTNRTLKKSFELRCLLSDVQRNLISVMQMAKQGFEVVMSEEGYFVSFGSVQFYPEI